MKKLISISLAILYFITLPFAANAQSGTQPAKIYFDPGDGEKVYLDSKDQFKVDVVIDTGGEDSSGADVIVTFDNTEVEFVSGSYIRDFYPNSAVSITSSSVANANERIEMAMVIEGSEDPVYSNGVGRFATLTFGALVDVGETVTLDFDFTSGSTVDTNVAGKDVSNPEILGQALSATLTIAEASSGGDDDPEITYIEPDEGNEGTNVVVHIYGKNFDPEEGTVHIGTWSSSVISWTDTEIVITVIGKNVFVDKNTQYPVKVTREDGKEALYNGYTFVDVGLPIIAWFGFVPINGALALVVKKKWFS